MTSLTWSPSVKCRDSTWKVRFVFNKVKCVTDVPVLCSSCTPSESERDGWHRSGWSWRFSWWLRWCQSPRHREDGCGTITAHRGYSHAAPTHTAAIKDLKYSSDSTPSGLITHQQHSSGDHYFGFVLRSQWKAFKISTYAFKIEQKQHVLHFPRCTSCQMMSVELSHEKICRAVNTQ